MKRLFPLLGFLAMVWVGCATSSTETKPDPVNLESVALGRDARANCKKISDVTVTCNSRQEVKGAIKEQAAKAGANYVQLTSLNVTSITGKYKARGIAFLCLD
jgi:hypothetical protein